MINDFIKDKTGVTSDHWTTCSVMNDTYLNCPIDDYSFNSHILAVHNPSLLPMPYLRMKVPHGNYSVYTWDIIDNSFNSSEAVVFCASRTISGRNQPVGDCELHV